MKRLASSGTMASDHSGRQRSKIACLPCRQRKRKCDSNLPCGTCLRYDYPCEYGSTSTDKQKSEDESSPPNIRPSRGRPDSNGKSSRQALTAPGARFQHRHILDPSKILFVRASAAIAFPRLLGMDLEFSKISPLRAFGWHLGIRNDAESTNIDIASLLTWGEMQSLVDTYFRVVNPEIGFLDREDFTEQATRRFTTSSASADLDAILLGVATLGSFFSAEQHPKEALMISAAQDMLVKYMAGPPTINAVAGWILRAIFLRLTSDAHGSYLASAIAMNIAAGCGLQKEINSVAIVYPAPAISTDDKLAKYRRRLFWFGRSLNVVLAFEYGRNSLAFDGITTRKPAKEKSSRTHIFIAMADILPSDHLDPSSSKDPTSGLLIAFSKLYEVETDSHFQNLLKADLVFAVYRRLWLMSLTDAKNQWDAVLSVGKKALEAAEALLQAKLPWWNVVHCTFQFLCIVLSIGNPQSLAFTNKIMELLHKISDAYNTHVVREAYNQASGLVKMSRDRKKRELEAISNYADENELSTVSTPAPNTTTDQFTFDWVSELPMNWEDLLNPDLMLSEQSINGTDLLVTANWDNGTTD